MSVIPYGLISVQRITTSLVNQRVQLFYVGRKKAKRIVRIECTPNGDYRLYYETTFGNTKTKIVQTGHLILTAFYDVSGRDCDELIDNAQSVGDIDRLSAISKANPHAAFNGVGIGCMCG